MDKTLVKRIATGEATLAEMQSVGAENIFAIKSDPEIMHARFYAGKAHGVDVDKRRVTGAVMSTDAVDRMGDIIKVNGWQLDDFKKNPQLLWVHNSRDLPLGKVLKPRRGKTSGGLNALMSDEEYHSEDENPHAELVFRLVAKGALPGRSVGFRGIEIKRPENDDEREKLGLGRWGVLYLKAELLEDSVVPIPANQTALQEKALERARLVYEEARETLPESVVAKVFSEIAFTEQDAKRIADEIRGRSIIVPDLSAIAIADELREAGVDVDRDPIDEAIAKGARALADAVGEEPGEEPSGARGGADDAKAASEADGEGASASAPAAPPADGEREGSSRRGGDVGDEHSIEVSEAEIVETLATLPTDAMLRVYRRLGTALDERLEASGLTLREVAPTHDLAAAQIVEDALAVQTAACRALTEAVDEIRSATAASSEQLTDAIEQLTEHLSESQRAQGGDSLTRGAASDDGGEESDESEVLEQTVRGLLADV